MAGKLHGRKILLGICGSIAAYKSAFFLRLLIKEGAEVKVVMTPASTNFISSLTLSTLSKHPVHVDISNEDGWNNHVDLGLWADLMIIAPATATSLAKMVNGLADNMLLATYLSAKCPIYFAPAMDLDMWKHPSTSHNLAQLKKYGNKLIPVGHGELASGLVGDGRMAEPEEMLDFVVQHFKSNERFHKKRVLITAGPTYEAIDPVRFIGNRSSGKMGKAIAEAFAEQGAEVDLVLGPSSLQIEDKNITVHRVTSAEDMYEKVHELYADIDIAVLAAAVADYRPLDISDQKIKKKEGNLKIELERTQDIAASIGKIKREGQLNVGFALETQNELENAKRKIVKKNFDLIVLNSLNDKGAGFKHDTNKVTIINKHNGITHFELKAKKEVAFDILDAVFNEINN